jgi:hypothetical protein
MKDEGHIGLSNEKVKEATSGDFKLALSYLKESARTAYFVIHVYSNTFDYSPYLQRSNVRGSDRRKNFLERLGFTYYESCNILGGPCYYKVIEEVPREAYNEDFMKDQQRVQMAHRKFDQLASRFGEIFQKMFEVDRILFESGFELPWEEEKLSPIIHGQEEKVYEKGQIYDFYKDIREITQSAKNEAFLVDAYVNEEALDLYLDKIPSGIKIRILTNKPQGNFITVAQKFKTKPSVDFEVRQNKDCHDRLFFVDNTCWVIGQSIKDAGKKPTYLARIESHDLFKLVFENLWNASSVLV